MPSLPDIPPDRPVLIAGPTACGKSALALEIAERHGGVIVNADASQVYGCWREITARPSPADEARVPHRLYGHVGWQQPYSAGHWLRDAKPLLGGGERPIFVGGTGLYFAALTQGMADIPAIPAQIRARGDAMTTQQMLSALDAPTKARIDTANRARVQRGWEVLAATGRGLADWQRDTPPPLLAPQDAVRLCIEAPRDWLNARIEARFDAMLERGALDEVAAMRGAYDPALPAFRAIGVPEITAHLAGEITLKEARARSIIATRQFAKRQRTWFRARMADWRRLGVGYP